MFFQSNYAKQLGMPDEFNVLEFHLHSLSEHTIDGVHFDLEMHIVHLPAPNSTVYQTSRALASAMGIIFDTKKAATNVAPEAIAAIDDFFDSLELGVDLPNSPTV